MTAAIPTLAEITSRTGVEVFDYLEADLAIPVTDLPQAQGDLLVIPAAMVADDVTLGDWPYAVHVESSGIVLLRSGAGGNPHTLVSEAGTCTWTTRIRDTTGLALGILDTDVVAYLIHPEHGATGIAPGRYVIRRQREFVFDMFEGVAGFDGPARGRVGFGGGATRFVVD